MENKNDTKKEFDEAGNYKFPYKKKFYSAYDKAGEAYLPVFPAETDMRAMRLLEDTVNNKQTELAKHPEDFRLDRIFEMDMRSGKVINNEIKTIIEAKELANG